MPSHWESSVSAGAEPACPALDSEPPAWVGDLMREAPESRVVRGGSASDRLSVLMRRTADWTHARAVVADALHLSRADFETAARNAYLAVLAAAGPTQTPVRFWNFVPHLNDHLDAEVDRYMAFNVGRFQAYVEWLSGPDSFNRGLATASAVGVEAPDLQVHCLAAAVAGSPVENPRQIAAYRYSLRYGPRPPCFARATRVVIAEKPVLLIGGTASIVGEGSRHPGDVRAQTRETLNNVEALVREAAGDPSPLDRVRDLRVYVRDATTAEWVSRMVRERCRGLTGLALVRAQICRKELLVEIEGIADLT